MHHGVGSEDWSPDGFTLGERALGDVWGPASHGAAIMIIRFRRGRSWWARSVRRQGSWCLTKNNFIKGLPAEEAGQEVALKLAGEYHMSHHRIAQIDFLLGIDIFSCPEPATASDGGWRSTHNRPHCR